MIISTKKVYKTYSNEFSALKNINIKILAEKSIAIVGKSGSGKSTLMHLLAGLDTPTSGSILFDETDIAKLNQGELAELRNNKIGFIFQQFFLRPSFSVRDNVTLPLKIRGVNQTERNERAEKALEAVGLLDKKNNKANDLSGGQKQRVAIARAIVNEPEILFADEPTGNLDSTTGKQIINLLFDLQKHKKTTLIVVTHDHELAEMCDSKIYVKDGEIITTKEL